MITHDLATKRVVDLLPGREEECFVLKSAFSRQECEEFLLQPLQSGFLPANHKYPESYRNNARFQVDDVRLANRLFEKVCTAIPNKLETEEKTLSLAGLNERLRYCKYAAGQSFSIHQDGVYYPTKGQESVLTFLLYLNDEGDYEGGETAFFLDRFGKTKLAEYSGCVGDVIVFDHKLWHSGQAVTRKNKYILRSDFIYKITKQKTLPQAHHDGYIWKLITLPGERIASASRDKSIKIWNKALHIGQTLTSHQNSVFDMACSDKLLFAVSRDGSLTIWQEGSHGYELVNSTNTMHRSALSVCVYEDLVFTSGADGCVRKWSKSGEMIFQKKVTDGWGWKVLSVLKQRLLVCTSKGEIKLLNISNFELISKYQLDTSVRCATAHEHFIYVGGESGFIYQLDINSLEPVDHWLAHNGIITDVTTKESRLISCGEDGKVMCLDLDSKQFTEIHSDKNFVTSLCWANDQNLLSASYTGRIEPHDIKFI